MTGPMKVERDKDIYQRPGLHRDVGPKTNYFEMLCTSTIIHFIPVALKFIEKTNNLKNVIISREMKWTAV